MSFLSGSTTGVQKLNKTPKMLWKWSKCMLCDQMPCVDKVMEAYDNQIKWAAYFRAKTCKIAPMWLEHNSRMASTVTDTVWLTPQQWLFITTHVNNNPRLFPVVNFFHASPPCCDLSSPYNGRNPGSSSHFSSGWKQTLNTPQVNVNKLTHPHMTHLSFLPNMARNRMPGCPLPSLITQHSWRLHAEGAAERLVWGWRGARWQWLIGVWLMATADTPALFSIVVGSGTSHLVNVL